MKEYNIPNEYRVLSKNSNGSQIKYKYNGIWFKSNVVGNESVSEYLVSLLLSCSNIKNYVSYEQCRVNGRLSCLSYDFLNSNEIVISFDKLYSMYYHAMIYNDIQSTQSVNERYRILVDSINNIVKIDISNYIDVILELDMITLNIDRHYGNIAVIYNTDKDSYRLAPIFDNGQSLGANYNIFPPYEDIEYVIDTSVACTISGSHEHQFAAMPINKLFIDYDRLFNLLDRVNKCREKDVLLYQLMRYRSIFDKRLS